MTGFLLIGVGLMTIVWGRWLAPLQLGKVIERATSEDRDRYDNFVVRPVVSRLLGLPAIVGGVAILLGVVFVISEL